MITKYYKLAYILGNITYDYHHDDYTDAVVNALDRTPNKDKKATCPECGLTFSNSGNAKRHYITKHAEQRPMNCPICRQEFPNKPRYGFN